MYILIVDDETFARKQICDLVHEICPEGVTTEADSLSEAKEALNQTEFSIIFLDINLKGDLGFDLVPFVPPQTKIVFITAMDKYAIRAFEVNAIDYIVKPPTVERIQNVFNKIENKKYEPVLKTFTLEDRVFVQTDETFQFIQLKEIQYIEAKDVYSMIYILGIKPTLIRKSLSDWRNILPENHFFRIHRSTIVNINKIHHISPFGKGTFHVYLNGLETQLVMSRSYAIELKKRLIV
ncbi:MAG: response regulator transcription factor [Candidatus Marinimicrobia bacterium]|nr:response regulator transcription factor [Candidatus Neomarinimicrobiota bacterium]MBT3675624.1 response regulator transcription factor [Candidatus Neomarinimicrobiota bacterium]MBT4371505.1 response regulator transcription factor [Candidatus Neomarinimicrobiota bacterium]MBT4808514.1 response regulator transcription factor [Candidatus Neomarinimicrobiota bacterium]MBT5174949.1 response regulator transcription factor [Candidatus Neomarinimicrobiota bacterium]